MIDTKQYHEIINVSWQFMKSHLQQIPLSDENWENIVDEARRFTESYAGTQLETFARKIIMECVSELKRADR